jgi:hypothetical protein
MPQWEYLCAWLDGEYYWVGPLAPYRISEDKGKTLDDLGSQGWEMVGISAWGAAGKFCAYFKRQKPQFPGIGQPDKETSQMSEKRIIGQAVRKPELPNFLIFVSWWDDGSVTEQKTPIEQTPEGMFHYGIPSVRELARDTKWNEDEFYQYLDVTKKF